MKCVCPSGGDRVCPDDCLLAVWHQLPEDDRKKRRKPIAEQLYRQGYTMEAIATQLGVDKATISRDLVDCCNMQQSKPAKTASNPKGSGRHKGSKNSKRKPGEKQAQRSVNAAPEDWERFKEKAAAEGYSSAAEKLGELVREPEVARDELPASSQEKLDTAIRQHKRVLDIQFEQRVLDEVKRRIDEIVLPHWKQKIDEAQQLYKRRRGAMDKATFNKIRRALHPDSRNSISDAILANAFDTFMGLEKFLLSEEDSPTEVGDLPRSWDDWERAKKVAAAERKRQRGHRELVR